MSKVYVDISLSLEVDTSVISYMDVTTNKIISYDEYNKLSDIEQKDYVIDSVSNLVKNSNVLELYNIIIEDTEI